MPPSSASSLAMPPRAEATTRVRSRPLLRAGAVIYALFTAGHTLGAMLGDTHRGPRQTALFDAMRAYTFDVQGITRSYWDFYRGFGFMVSVLLAMTAILCWILADIGQRHPRDARRVVNVLIVGMAFITWFSFVDFFTAPMLFAASGILCLIAASIALGREAAKRVSDGAR